jgi:glycosyltransferase involved in cell wall biosynthesis
MVSIIMSTYNRASTLPRAIDSIMRQTDGDWELIIVDDGSTDETSQVLAGIVDPRIRVYRHPTNRGVTATKNTGLDQIRGDWFTLLDDDDEATPDALAVMLECARTTGATAVTCNCLDSVTGRTTGIGPSHDGRISAKDAARCRGEHWGLTRTNLLGDLRFDERLPGWEDTVWLLIHQRARRYYTNRALRIYHTEGADRVMVAGSNASLRERVRIYSVLGENKPFLRALRAIDTRRYLRTLSRVWAARVLRPFLPA